MILIYFTEENCYIIFLMVSGSSLKHRNENVFFMVLVPFSPLYGPSWCYFLVFSIHVWYSISGSKNVSATFEFYFLFSSRSFFFCFIQFGGDTCNCIFSDSEQGQNIVTIFSSPSLNLRDYSRCSYRPSTTYLVDNSGYVVSL
ncbi:hypothetical protein BJX65DRAFT_48665 [Aspergillus insuetus]